MSQHHEVLAEQSPLFGDEHQCGWVKKGQGREFVSDVAGERFETPVCSGVYRLPLASCFSHSFSSLHILLELLGYALLPWMITNV